MSAPGSQLVVSAKARQLVVSAKARVEQLAWYDAALQQDAYVKGASIFALAPQAAGAHSSCWGAALTCCNNILRCIPDDETTALTPNPHSRYPR